LSINDYDHVLGYLQKTLDSAWYDYVLVQFYNNWCNPGTNFNYDEWEQWAQSKSTNKDVRVMFGTPGSASAAGSGYVGFGCVISFSVIIVCNRKLEDIVKSIKSSAHFGGISMWDASQSFANKNGSQTFSQYAKSLL
jgi:chitinase